MKIQLSPDASAQKHVPGHQPAVDDDGRPVPVAPGEIIEVRDPEAKALLAQSDKWRPAAKPAPKKEA